MASGQRMSWEMGDTEREVGLGLNIQFQFQQPQQDHPSRFEGTRPAFTEGQRQELERQTVIYKYMMASMPVPPELLIPLSKFHSSPSDFSVLLHSRSSEAGRRGGGKNGAGLELRYTTSNSNNNNNNTSGTRERDRGGADPEPWRCRRTDGKKWRCSRDVAPDQKYCERHSHKGRPSRSRKPVESLHLSPTATTTATAPNTTATPSTCCNPITLRPPSSSSFDFASPPLPHYNQFPRYPEWYMRKDNAAAPLCPQLMHPIPMGADHTRAVGDADIGTNATANSSQKSISHLSPLNEDQSCILPRPFIDAWSLRDLHSGDAPTAASTPTVSTSCPASSPLHSVLPLTLGIDHDFNHSNNDNSDQAIRTSNQQQHQPLNWMNSRIPGGPLAEALCLGMSMSGTMAHGIGTNSDELLSPHGHSTSSSTSTTGSKASHASADTSALGFHLA